MTGKVVLGIDIARSVGVAVLPSWDPDGIRSWTQRFDQPAHGELYDAWYAFIRDTYFEVSPDLIAWEEVEVPGKFMSRDWMRLYFGMRSILLLYCEKFKIPYVPVTINQVKKLATGNGNAKKAQVLAAARTRWPDNLPETDNDADARYIAEVGLSILED